MAKNPAGKMRKPDNPYATWTDPGTGWTYHLLKSWQANNDKPHARWFVRVEGWSDEMGDEYVSNLRPILLLYARPGGLVSYIDSSVWERPGLFYAWVMNEE